MEVCQRTPEGQAGDHPFRKRKILNMESMNLNKCVCVC